MKARLLIWRGAGQLVLHRPWFEFDERPFPLSLYLFGYGPEFFQYIFPPEQPLDLTDPQVDVFLRFAQDAHNDLIHRTVELGFFGIASYLFLLGSLIATGASLVIGKLASLDPNLKLVMAAAPAGIGGRTVEQPVGIPHLSDEALFWTLVALLVALPSVTPAPLEAEGERRTTVSPPISTSSGYVTLGTKASRLSVALLLASGLVVFTMIKNPYYFLAEIKATAAESALMENDLPRALQQIDEAISLAPDASRLHVTRATMLDKVRNSSVGRNDQFRLARESYLTNQRAVTINPFDVYSRLYFAESAFTLAELGLDGMGENPSRNSSG